MSETKIVNVWKELYLWVLELLNKGIPTKIPYDKAQKIIIKDIEKKIKELEKLVEKAKGFIDKGKGLDLQKKGKGLNLEFIGKVFEAEDYGVIIDYGIQNSLIRDLETTKKNLDKLFTVFEGLIPKSSENQSSGNKKEDNIALCNVWRCVLYLSCFPEDFVFNLKRITRLSVPNEFIPKNLEQLPADFLKVADTSWDSDGAPNHVLLEVPNHFLLKDNGRERNLESGQSNQNEYSYPTLICHVGTDLTRLPDFTKFEFLRILSLRKVKLTDEINLNLNKLSSVQYLDLKHTNVENISWLKDLEKLLMLDLRYTCVKNIPDDCLEKLGNLQHLLLGYIKERGDNMLTGAKLNPKKLTKNLKTLRSVGAPEVIKEISSVRDVVDLSVTGLTKENLKSFWDTVKKFNNLTSLGVAMSVTEQSAITLPDCGDNLKNKLKRLRMEVKFPNSSNSDPSHAWLGKLCDFEKLNDLTLASNNPINIDSIPALEKLLCLRFYGVCNEKIFKIEAQQFKKLKKLVIGDMENLEMVQIDGAVIGTLATLKLCKLPKLKELVCPDKQQSLLKWGKNTAEGCSKEDQSLKTIFLRGFDDIPDDKSPCLTIYHYDMNKQCYNEVKYNP